MPVFLGLAVSLFRNFERSFTKLDIPFTKVVVAYSGGLDSSVLLKLSQQLFTKHPHIALVAVHVNHGLQQQAKQWQRHCQEQAELFGVPFVAESVELQIKPRESIESAARTARYAALAKHVDSESLLLTAHHADDQFETLMLALKRGSGLSGLAAMPDCRRFAQGHLFRPLLVSTRADLQCYAQESDLSWIEDPSNQSMQFDRNFLRHQVLPELTQRWPQLLQTVQRSVTHLQESKHLIDELAASDMRNCALADSIDCAQLLLLSEARCKNVLRFWLNTQSWSYPSQAQLQQVVAQCQAKADAKVTISLPQGQIRRFKGRLYLVDKASLFEQSEVDVWDMNAQPCLELQNGSRLSWHKGGRLLPPGSAQRVSIRFRDELSIDSFNSAERHGHRSIKKLLQEAHLKPWLRNRIPFVFYDEHLVAIADLYTSKAFLAERSEGIRLKWQASH